MSVTTQPLPHERLLFRCCLAASQEDPSSITAPPFVPSPTSVTEIRAAWASRHGSDAAARALLVLKNFFCNLKLRGHTAADVDGVLKKPLNARLRELFIGEFGNAGERPVRVVAEQVSHHPPVTADGLRGSRVGGGAACRPHHHPRRSARPVAPRTLTGAYPELDSVCYVVSSSGLLSTVEFTERRRGGGGEENTVRAELARSPREGDGEEKGEILYNVTGQWSGRLTITECATGAVLEAFDVDDIPLIEIRTRPPEGQSPWESRRAWRDVVERIRRLHKLTEARLTHNIKKLLDRETAAIKRERAIIMTPASPQPKSLLIRLAVEQGLYFLRDGDLQE
ncbi:hypothetical protein F4824DRAFT_498303 [Ustulina deusta]|nr:hypothetical protein F4824DRAFT_498303 [Ustulina deusta]